MKPGEGQDWRLLRIFLTYWVEDNDVTNQAWRFRTYLHTDNQNMFLVSFGNEYILLASAYDPTGTGSLKLPENSEHRFNYFWGSFRSDPGRKLNTIIELFTGEYYNGKGISFSGETGYRVQPYGSLSMDYNVSRIVLPRPYATTNLLLIGPRLDVTFSRKIFLSTLFQYNNQIDNININARIQWRYKPVSDLYLVYTDNYFASTLVEKNRAVVFKLTYWLNV